MRTTWIVAADSSRARIFEVKGINDHLHEIGDFMNPAGRAMTAEINTDRYGRFHGNGQPGSASQPNVGAAEHETELFSKRVSDFLRQGQLEHRYHELCLIAFPKFLGMMRQNLSKEVQKLVTDEVPKDISSLNVREIEDYVRHKLQ